MMIKITKKELLEHCNDAVQDAIKAELADWLTDCSSDQMTDNVLTPIRDYMLNKVKEEEGIIIKEAKQLVADVLKDDIENWLDVDNIIKEAREEAKQLIANKISEKVLSKL